ncbi:Rrf2 family transcriptional regulator [Sporomusa sp. KB1]|jgi:Rrf2 family protein|uniref:RrF2 family transcriptional regulator n=1 Tax=Sporomusa sp. KB1 TaxID=943346 RepID=UPI00119F16EA|nr:RrF2 family transcriptional regulator [Sporomusa sp. KB1]TWH48050.1 BadM/Rrf2 family transcriptional regulator [Sporomusa sp. KB1]
MKLSTKGRYGVKAVLELAINQENGHVSIKAIAQRQKVSEYYLEQLFAQLRVAGIVKSIRGAHGGYSLNRSPAEITVYDIINVLEGSIEISDCIEDTVCDNIDCCATRLLWVRIKDSIDNVLKSTTLQDMIDDYSKMKAIKEGVKDE